MKTCRGCKLIGLVLLMSACTGAAPRTDDYLPPELRSRVERLKQDAGTPTTWANYRERAGLVWDWANALSLTGTTLNPDLPLAVAIALNPDVDSMRADPAAGGRWLNRYSHMDMLIHELTMRDELPPEAFGSLATDVSTPLVAGSYQTLQLTYVVGQVPIRTGGGLVVSRHFQSYPFPEGTNFQAHDPLGEGYVTVRASDPAVVLTADTVIWDGIHGRDEVGTNPLVFHVTGGELDAGDTVTVTFGDTLSGSPGMLIQNYSNDAVPLPVYVDFEGRGQFVSLPLQTFEVIGKPVHAVHAFAPSVVAAGEEFALSVRSEDIHLNRASGPIPSYEIRVNDRPFRTLSSGREAISLLGDVRFDEPGVYRFTIRSADGRVTGQSNPVWVRDGVDWRVYWGDIHGHSGFAEGLGTPDGYFRFGRDEARLDFLTHSEHDLWMDDYEWQALTENVARFTEEGEFVTFLGYEWTVNTLRGGHHNVLFRNPDGRQRVPLQEAPVLSRLYQGLAEQNELQDVLIVPHAHQAGEWRMNHPDMERLVEIMSGHGNFEWFGRRYLGFGHQVGFAAASDDHFSHPGYSAPFLYAYTQRSGLTAVQAPEKTTDAIFDALRARRTYATTGQRMILDVRVNGAPMGSRTPMSDVRRIRGRVTGTAPIDRVTLVKNGHDIQTRDYLTEARGPIRTIEVVFWSDADPDRRDNPRPWRRWEGTLEVTGADLVSVSAPAIRNHVLQRAERRGSNAVDFVLMTRGLEKSTILELAGVEEDAEIRLGMRAASDAIKAFYERLDYAYPLGAIVTLPGTGRFPLGEMRDGRLTRVFPDGEFHDSVTVRRIQADATMDRAFEFVDSTDASPGDYYYVRVIQLDDGTAWSSPTWVGGFDRR